MKTKLDLYLATQDAAQKTLDATHKAAEATISELVKPLAAEDQAFASQLFWSRRQRMQELAGQELTAAPEPAKAKVK